MAKLISAVNSIGTEENKAKFEQVAHLEVNEAGQLCVYQPVAGTSKAAAPIFLKTDAIQILQLKPVQARKVDKLPAHGIKLAWQLFARAVAKIWKKFCIAMRTLFGLPNAPSKKKQLDQKALAPLPQNNSIVLVKGSKKSSKPSSILRSPIKRTPKKASLTAPKTNTTNTDYDLSFKANGEIKANGGIKDSGGAIDLSSPFKADNAAHMTSSPSKTMGYSKIQERLFVTIDDFFAQKESLLSADIWTIIGRVVPFDAIFPKAVDAGLERIGAHVKVRYENGNITAADVLQYFDKDPIVAKKISGGKVPELTKFLKSLDPEFETSEGEASDSSYDEAQLALRSGMTLYIEKMLSSPRIEANFQDMLDGLVNFAGDDVAGIDFAIQELLSKITQKSQEKSISQDVAFNLLQSLHQHPVICKRLVESREQYQLLKLFADGVSQQNGLRNDPVASPSNVLVDALHQTASDSFMMTLDALKMYGSGTKSLGQVQNDVSNFLDGLYFYALEAIALTDDRAKAIHANEIRGMLSDLMVMIEDQVEPLNVNFLLAFFEGKNWLRDYITHYDQSLMLLLNEILQRNALRNEPLVPSSAPSDPKMDALHTTAIDSYTTTLDTLQMYGSSAKTLEQVQNDVSNFLDALKSYVLETKALTDDRAKYVHTHEIRGMLSDLLLTIKEQVSPQNLNALLAFFENQEWLRDFITDHDDLYDLYVPLYNRWIHLDELTYSLDASTDDFDRLTGSDDGLGGDIAFDDSDIVASHEDAEIGDIFLGDSSDLVVSEDLDDDSELLWPEAHLELDACLKLMRKNNPMKPRLERATVGRSDEPINPFILIQTVKESLQKFMDGGEYMDALSSPAVNGKYEMLLNGVRELLLADTSDETSSSTSSEDEVNDKLVADARASWAFGWDDVPVVAEYDDANVDLDDGLERANEYLASDPLMQKRILVQLNSIVQSFDEGSIHHQALENEAVSGKLDALKALLATLPSSHMAPKVDDESSEDSIKSEEAPIEGEATVDEIAPSFFSWGMSEEVPIYEEESAELDVALDLAAQYADADSGFRRRIQVQLKSTLQLFAENDSYQKSLENEDVNSKHENLKALLQGIQQLENAPKLSGVSKVAINVSGNQPMAPLPVEMAELIEEDNDFVDMASLFGIENMAGGPVDKLAKFKRQLSSLRNAPVAINEGELTRAASNVANSIKANGKTVAEIEAELESQKQAVLATAKEQEVRTLFDDAASAAAAASESKKQLFQDDEQITYQLDKKIALSQRKKSSAKGRWDHLSTEAREELRRLTDLRSDFSAIKRNLEDKKEELANAQRIIDQNQAKLDYDPEHLDKDALEAGIKRNGERIIELQAEKKEFSRAYKKILKDSNCADAREFVTYVNRQIIGIKKGSIAVAKSEDSAGEDYSYGYFDVTEKV